MMAGIYFTVKIQNPAKRRLLAIYTMEKRFAAIISAEKFRKILKKYFSTIFLIDSISLSHVASFPGGPS